MPQYALGFIIDPSNQQSRGQVNQSSNSRNNATTTLDKIWLCDDLLCDFKDLSLAFALSRVLRCRLEGVELHKKTLRINRELIKSRIIVTGEENAKRAFGIIELHLAFLNDYFNTRYPMIFWYGLPSLFISIILCFVNSAVVCWLSVEIFKVYGHSDSVQGRNVYITYVFMFLMVIKEFWEMWAYIKSDWTVLLITCLYQRLQCKCMTKLLSLFFKPNITSKRWHGHIDQYFFLKSYDYSPTVWNPIHKLTCTMLPKRDEGAELSGAISVPDYVKSAILEKLSSLDHNHGCLPNMMTSVPTDSHQRSRYRWALELPTCSHIILVWHIATSLCEIELAKQHNVDSGKPGLMCGLFSFFTTCCSSKPYLVDEQKLSGDLQKSYIVANSLSLYCAYLLVSKPELIPDSFLVPKSVFQSTVRRARDDILKNCDSLESSYNKLVKQEAEKAAKDSEKVKNSDDILRQGALLAKELIDHDEGREQFWKIL